MVCGRENYNSKKRQASKVLSTKKRNSCRFSENDRAFYSLPSFFFTLQRLPREKFHFKRKTATFLCVGVKSYRERARSENSARSRNQSGCRIWRILPAYALRKKRSKLSLCVSWSTFQSYCITEEHTAQYHFRNTSSVFTSYATTFSSTLWIIFGFKFKANFLTLVQIPNRWVIWGSGNCTPCEYLYIFYIG